MAQEKICTIEGCGKRAMGRGYCGLHYNRWRKYGDNFPPDRSATNGAIPMFLLRSLITETDDCILWPFTLPKPHGRPYVRLEPNRQGLASRYICQIKHGMPPTPKHEAAHSCGKGHLGCINWKHLRWATRKENEADKLLHGTLVVGEASPKSKLKEADVLEIRKRYAAGGVTQEDLGKEFGINQTTVGIIIRRGSWKHV